MQTFFVTGTDTDVGKTVVSSGLMLALKQRGHTVIGHKPISAGCELVVEDGTAGLRNEDAMTLMAQASMALPYEWVNPIAFAPAIAPHIAADMAKQSIDEKVLDEALVRLQQVDASHLLIEGAGGWALPIGEGQLLSTWVAKHQLPVVIVVAMRLGCLNHALLTYQAVKASGCEVLGWVANDFCDQPFATQNIETLKSMIDAPCLGVVGKASSVNDASNAEEVAVQLDVSPLG